MPYKNPEEAKAYHKAYREANREKKRIWNKAYREANKEDIAIKMKAYRQANKEDIVIKDKAYRQANKEHISGYNRAYRQANKEDIAIKDKAYRQANKEHIKAYLEANKEHIKAYRQANKERIKAKYKEYYCRTPKAKFNIKSAAYRAAKFRATIRLTELDTFVIEECYRLSQLRTTKTGFAWHVDHIIPLSKGGLHKPTNLQVVPAVWNLKKHNRNNNRWLK